MTKRGKLFELLDIPKFARPSVSNIAPTPTASVLIDRLAGKSFMSYGQLWPHITDVVEGRADDQALEGWFCAYRDEWKNRNIRDACRLLRDLIGGRGRWYPALGRPQSILGVWFRSSIKGVWFFEGKAYAVLVNARKGQLLSRDDVLFLARGIYELHCVDDPNDPIPLIIDLSEVGDGEGREARSFIIDVEEAVPYAAFETSVRRFMEALRIAGVALPAPETGQILDLFKRR